jgi:hypothetical protein
MKRKLKLVGFMLAMTMLFALTAAGATTTTGGGGIGDGTGGIAGIIKGIGDDGTIINGGGPNCRPSNRQVAIYEFHDSSNSGGSWRCTGVTVYDVYECVACPISIMVFRTVNAACATWASCPGPRWIWVN